MGKLSGKPVTLFYKKSFMSKASNHSSRYTKCKVKKWEATSTSCARKWNNFYSCQIFKLPLKGFYCAFKDVIFKQVVDVDVALHNFYSSKLLKRVLLIFITWLPFKKS